MAKKVGFFTIPDPILDIFGHFLALSTNTFFNRVGKEVDFFENIGKGSKSPFFGNSEKSVLGKKREKKYRVVEAGLSTILGIFSLLFWPCEKCVFSCNDWTQVYPLFQKSLSWFGTFQKFLVSLFYFFFWFLSWRGNLKGFLTKNWHWNVTFLTPLFWPFFQFLHFPILSTCEISIFDPVSKQAKKVWFLTPFLTPFSEPLF